MPLPSAIPEQLYPLALAAIQAGQRIRQLEHSQLAFTTKADGSPVCEADRQAEDMILAELARLYPGIPAFGEESIAQGALLHKPPGCFFIVDPLDGTREFEARRDEYTVNIALIENNRPQLSILHAPALGQTYAALKNHGAWRALHGVENTPLLEDFKPIAPRKQPISNPIAYVSRSHMDDKTRAFLNRNPHFRLIPLGSSLKFARVAEGAGDLYPRFGPIKEWDTAAGDLLLTAAGGLVLDMAGLPLAYGKKDKEFDTVPFIASGTA
jgi:3'(2'), 5'-bisphosphate nucleotidase